MAPRAPIQLGINPTMAVYTVVLGITCAVAAYSEKYRRNQDDIDDKLMERYMTNMKEQQAKVPQITQAIRGEDLRLDGTMNKWVWGGKASSLPAGGPTGRGHYPTQTALVSTTEQETENEQPSVGNDGGGRSSNNKTTSLMNTTDEDDNGVDESQLSKKERRRRRKERKEKQRLKDRMEEEQRLELQKQKFILQGVAVGTTVGAIAVAASVFLSSSTGRK